MRCAVCVPKLSRNQNDNIKIIFSMMSEAARGKASLALFPETVITGLVNCDVYEKDVKLAPRIDSPLIRSVAEHVKNCGLWTAIGFFELCGETIYDSAILIDNDGKIVLHHRRMNPGWRAEDANPSEYGEGTHLDTVITPLGKTAILICGDLFEHGVEAAVNQDIDLLLFPFARCFSSEVTDFQKEWDENEWPAYSEQIKKIGAFTLMSNYIALPDLAGGAFGGAFAAGPDGELLANKPLFEDGILFYDTPDV